MFAYIKTHFYVILSTCQNIKVSIITKKLQNPFKLVMRIFVQLQLTVVSITFQMTVRIYLSYKGLFYRLSVLLLKNMQNDLKIYFSISTLYNIYKFELCFLLFKQQLFYVENFLQCLQIYANEKV